MKSNGFLGWHFRVGGLISGPDKIAHFFEGPALKSEQLAMVAHECDSTKHFRGWLQVDFNCPPGPAACFRRGCGELRTVACFLLRAKKGKPSKFRGELFFVSFRPERNFQRSLRLAFSGLHGGWTGDPLRGGAFQQSFSPVSSERCGLDALFLQKPSRNAREGTRSCTSVTSGNNKFGANLPRNLNSASTTLGAAFHDNRPALFGRRLVGIEEEQSRQNDVQNLRAFRERYASVASACRLSKPLYLTRVRKSQGPHLRPQTFWRWRCRVVDFTGLPSGPPNG